MILLHSTIVLEDAGYEVLPHAGAAAALACLAGRADIDALFTDVELPGGPGGLELAATVRAARPDMAIVVTSGKQALDLDTLPVGGRFMAKPYTNAQIRRVLAEERVVMA